MATASALSAHEGGPAEMSTPLNRLTRENLTVLVRNNVLNDSVEFASDCDASMMETTSPAGKPAPQLISKKLFHSPMVEDSPKGSCTTTVLERISYLRTSALMMNSRKSRKRRQSLLPDSEEKIKRACVAECERDGRSPRPCAGMRQRVLISLFHNKEYAMDFS